MKEKQERYNCWSVLSGGGSPFSRLGLAAAYGLDLSADDVCSCLLPASRSDRIGMLIYLRKLWRE